MENISYASLCNSLVWISYVTNKITNPKKLKPHHIEKAENLFNEALLSGALKYDVYRHSFKKINFNPDLCKKALIKPNPIKTFFSKFTKNEFFLNIINNQRFFYIDRANDLILTKKFSKNFDTRIFNFLAPLFGILTLSFALYIADPDSYLTTNLKLKFVAVSFLLSFIFAKLSTQEVLIDIPNLEAYFPNETKNNSENSIEELKQNYAKVTEELKDLKEAVLREGYSKDLSQKDLECLKYLNNDGKMFLGLAYQIIEENKGIYGFNKDKLKEKMEEKIKGNTRRTKPYTAKIDAIIKFVDIPKK